MVAGAGIEPASGDYEPPEVTVPPPRVLIIFTMPSKATMIVFLDYFVKIILFMRRKLLWFLIIVFLAGGIYFFLKKENSFDYFVYNFNPGEKKSPKTTQKDSGSEILPANLLGGAGEKLEAQLSQGLDKGESLVNQAAEAIKTKTSELQEEVKEKTLKNTLDFLKNSLDKGIEAVGSAFGVEVKRDEFSPIADPASIIRYSTRLNETVYFSIKNPLTEARNFQYEVDWGDGFKENGELQEGAVKPVSHFWKNEGEYLVLFKIITSVGNVDYKNYIVVLK